VCLFSIDTASDFAEIQKSVSSCRLDVVTESGLAEDKDLKIESRILQKMRMKSRFRVLCVIVWTCCIVGALAQDGSASPKRRKLRRKMPDLPVENGAAPLADQPVENGAAPLADQPVEILPSAADDPIELKNETHESETTERNGRG
jgi:hypothetical protein